MAKLKREEQEEGLYVLRWSVVDFSRLILSVLRRGQVRHGRLKLGAFISIAILTIVA